jgi:predicted nucleotidyltransferase
LSDLTKRRETSRSRLTEVRHHLSDSEALAMGKACVYATGSFARGESSQFSDLDLFIVGKCGPEHVKAGSSSRPPERLLKRLDEICIKAELISATRELRIPEFSGDGEYLTFYTVRELVRSLGRPDDDATNTFTARLLLLLESVPLVEASVYDDVIAEVVLPYWRDFEDHQHDFMPAFLANDILRLWRTFCVNYEARTDTDPAEKKAKRKLKNYKLKHSRMLTCYSALLYLLAVYKLRGTVKPQDAVSMTQLTPTQRLEWLKGEIPKATDPVDILLGRYEKFLDETNAEEKVLVERFLQPVESKRLIGQSYAFGDALYDLLDQVGTGDDGEKGRFYRLIVV